MTSNEQFTATGLQSYEDAEQASTLAHPTICLPFDPATATITTGPYQGQNVDEVSERIAMGHLMDGRAVYRTVKIRRVWWKPWARTISLSISVIGDDSGFAQAFDDGGPA